MSSSFRPPWWARSPHFQTIIPVLTKVAGLPLRRERLELEDGDFIDLDWLKTPIPGKPLLVILHGLEGSADSHYIRRLLRECQKQELAAVVHHHRGCSGEDNRLARSYHSGDTADISHSLQTLKQRYPHSPLLAVGYSLGGNVLAKYQGEFADKSLLSRAAVVSAPLALASCAKRLEKGFSKVYQSYLIRQLQQKMLLKLERGNSQLPLNGEAIKRLNTFYDFDHQVTAPLHGFNGVDDYYQRASALPLLGKIAKPTLILHAADDPFMTDAVIPLLEHLPACVEYELHANGGHVGFIEGGTPWQPRYYLEQRLLRYLTESTHADTL
ncbi:MULTISPECIES: hydrolase [Shewanella]|uniref:hydrolase n=1 Tax=Shewanella TaxID=22 RepID=UPI001431FD3F|nr:MULTISPECIES: hydrolase [Shewanella]MBO2551078.1 hydrolase [Shewanella algae]NJI85004.1 hydrolase [Shewanella sp. Iso12]